MAGNPNAPFGYSSIKPWFEKFRERKLIRLRKGKGREGYWVHLTARGLRLMKAYHRNQSLPEELRILILGEEV
jgi:molybdenum-dependent DNA-binding transcriptional regulator ModE